MPHPDKNSEFSFGVNYKLNDNFTFGVSHERDSYLSLKFTYKNNPQSSLKSYEYQKADNNNVDNKYEKLVNNLEENGIGVKKITETSRSLGLQLTQFMHSDIALVEQIIKESSRDAGINKNIKKDIKIADLDAITEIDESFKEEQKQFMKEIQLVDLILVLMLVSDHFLPQEKNFLKVLFWCKMIQSLLLEKIFLNTNLKYNLKDNFDDLKYPPVDTYPAQVRSDVKQYLLTMDRSILIGRAQA